MQAKIYSYRRVSTAKQLKGTGLAQQTEQDTLDRLSKEYSLPISEEIFSDEGKSAFHGTHLENELGRVLQLIDDGHIASGSILVIMSLDRLSRQGVGHATRMLLDILLKGVRIYTTIDNKLLCDSNPNHMADLMMVLVAFQRANEESTTKSVRVRGAAIKAIEAHQDGSNRSDDDYAKAVTAVGGKHPFYIDISDGFVRAHKTNWSTAKLIIQRILAGKGIAAVIDEVNGMGHTFSRQMLHKFIKSSNLIGSREITINGTKHILKNYFPPLLTQTEFNQLKTVTAGRTISSAPSGHINIVSGMGILRCIGGGTLSSKVSANTYRLICTYKADFASCNGMSFKSVWLEQAVLNVVPDALMAANKPIKSNSERDDLLAQIQDKQDTLQGFSDRGLKSIPKTVIAMIFTLEAEIEALQDTLNSIVEVSAEDIGSLSEQWKSIKVLPPIDDSEARSNLKLLIKKSIKSITVKKLQKTSEYRFTFTLVNGQVRSIDCLRGKYSTPIVSDMPDNYIGPYEMNGELEDTHRAYENEVLESALKWKSSHENK